jgi:hypothetical protein
VNWMRNPVDGPPDRFEAGRPSPLYSRTFARFDLVLHFLPPWPVSGDQIRTCLSRGRPPDGVAKGTSTREVSHCRYDCALNANISAAPDPVRRGQPGPMKDKLCRTRGNAACDYTAAEERCIKQRCGG